MQLLIYTWLAVAVVVVIVHLVNRYPPQSQVVRYAIAGAAGTALLCVVLMVVIALIQVPAARDGMIVALLIVLMLGGALRLIANPPHITLPFPRRTAFAAEAEGFTVVNSLPSGGRTTGRQSSRVRNIERSVTP